MNEEDVVRQRLSEVNRELIAMLLSLYCESQDCSEAARLERRRLEQKAFEEVQASLVIRENLEKSSAALLKAEGVATDLFPPGVVVYDPGHGTYFVGQRYAHTYKRLYGYTVTNPVTRRRRQDSTVITSTMSIVTPEDILDPGLRRSAETLIVRIRMKGLEDGGERQQQQLW